MKAVLWGIALANLCLLQTAAGITAQPDFDPNKVAGLWYGIGVTMDQGTRPTNGFQLHVRVQNGDIVVNAQSTKHNCRKVGGYFARTDQPGIFTLRGTPIILSILKTDHKGHVILHIKKPGQSFIRLYVKRQSASEAEKEMFRNLATSLGFPAENMEIVPHVGQCPL